MNLPSEIRRVVLPSEQQAAEAEIQPQNLEIAPIGLEGILAKINTSVVEKAETRAKAAIVEGTLVTEANVDTAPTSEAALISTLV